MNQTAAQTTEQRQSYLSGVSAPRRRVQPLTSPAMWPILNWFLNWFLQGFRISRCKIYPFTPVQWRWMEFCLWCPQHWIITIQRFDSSISFINYIYCQRFSLELHSFKEKHGQHILGIIQTNWDTVFEMTGFFVSFFKVESNTIPPKCHIRVEAEI